MAEYSFDTILGEMLAEVPDTLSKRVGEPIHTTLAPVSIALAKQDHMMGYLFNLLFADTSEDMWLDRVVYDFGLTRDRATKALRKITAFDSEQQPFDPPATARFAINELTFKLTEKTAPGVYYAECEQTGNTGNLYSGAMLAVDNIAEQGGKRFGGATLDPEPIIAARDEETDDSLRARYYAAVRETPFGGNKADYRQKTHSIDGVGEVEVFGAPVMGAGNVGLIIGDEQENRASQELIDRVQTLYGTNGDGLAPIYHTVYVKTSTDLVVDVAAPVRLKSGASLAIVQPIVTQTVQDYIDNIKFREATVFLAKLIAAILNCHESILDVGAVTFNGDASNISLQKTFDRYEVPTVGTITVTEVV